MTAFLLFLIACLLRAEPLWARLWETSPGRESLLLWALSAQSLFHTPRPLWPRGVFCIFCIKKKKKFRSFGDFSIFP